MHTRNDVGTEAPQGMLGKQLSDLWRPHHHSMHTTSAARAPKRRQVAELELNLVCVAAALAAAPGPGQQALENLTAAARRSHAI